MLTLGSYWFVFLEKLLLIVLFLNFTSLKRKQKLATMTNSLLKLQCFVLAYVNVPYLYHLNLVVLKLLLFWLNCHLFGGLSFAGAEDNS